MAVMTSETRITRKYLERKTKSDLAQMFLDLLDSDVRLENAARMVLNWERDYRKVNNLGSKAPDCFQLLSDVLSGLVHLPISEYQCHVVPDERDLERNKAVEPEGERLREELTEWLKKNGIVGIRLDTPEHLVRIDIMPTLPPRIKFVLRLWGSISVRDDRP
jgi:hypothetical protein